MVALCGGVGGAKLALGLERISQPGTTTIVVNVGDDFEHLGLRICPDVDTVLYTLMTTIEQKIQLARDVIDAAASLRVHSVSHWGASR